jgi:hypothetical protein
MTYAKWIDEEKDAILWTMWCPWQLSIKRKTENTGYDKTSRASASNSTISHRVRRQIGDAS